MKWQVRAGNSGERDSVRAFCKKYNIKNALDNITAVWKEVKESTLKLMWCSVWHEHVHSFTGLLSVKQIHRDIIDFSSEAEFKNTDEDDIQEVLGSHTKDIFNEELMEMREQIAQGEEGGEEEELALALNLKTFKEFLQMMNQVLTFVQEKDPNPTQHDAT